MENNNNKTDTTHEAKDARFYKEYYDYFNHLFQRAYSNGGIEYIFTLLRVSGIRDGGWDPFVEAHEALFEFSKILQKISKKGLSKSSYRLALLIYCHSIEMSTPYHILYNLLRCIQHKQYVPFPFMKNSRAKKRFSLKIELFHPIEKIRELETESKNIGEQELIAKIYSFFDNEIRNAFYHSSYALTDTEFRICEGTIKSIPLTTLSEKLSRCFAFYSAFFDIYDQIRFTFRKMKKFHRLQNFEVLELITDKKEGLIGFKMHFSNNSTALFERRKERVQGINVILNRGGINFMVGNLGDLKYKWMANGKAFREKNTRYNSSGVWRPIIFTGNTDKLHAEIRKETFDNTIHECLFYIRATGHESIEFVIKSNKPLFTEKELIQNKIKATPCNCSTNDAYVYDCTYFVNSDKVNAIKRGLSQIEKFVDTFRDKNREINYSLKYSSKGKPELSHQIDKKGFVASFSMDNPRNISCVSSFKILPNTNWEIKPEWIG